MKLAALIFVLGMTAHAQAVSSAVALTSPTPGSTLTSASTTFIWAAGPTGTTGYGLNVGTKGVGSADLINIGPLQGTSVIVKFPVNYVAIYVRLWTESAGCGGTCYVFNDYTYLGALANPLTGFTCATESPAAVNCVVTLTSAAPIGGTVVLLSSSAGSAVTLPASVTVPAGATTASFTVTINSATLNATLGAITGVAETATIGLGTLYAVNLSWLPPVTSPDPVAGYNVFRSLASSSTYTQLNLTPVTTLSFTDLNVQDGATYDYIVESVDAAGVKSAPSNMASVSVP